MNELSYLHIDERICTPHFNADVHMFCVCVSPFFLPFTSCIICVTRVTPLAALRLPPPASGTVPSFHCGGAALIASAKLISPSEKAAKQVAAASVAAASSAAAASATSLVDSRMATAAAAVAPPVPSLYDLRKLSTEAVAVAVATELAHRPKPKCEWEEYPHRRIAFSYRTIHRKSAGACVETCCKSRRCKAVSIRNDTATSAVCTLHGEFQMLISAPATDWGVFRKVDVEG